MLGKIYGLVDDVSGCVCESVIQSAINGRANFFIPHTTKRIIVFCSPRFPLKCI